MRDIIFRGKRIDNGEWVYGYYVKLYGGKKNKISHRIYTGSAGTDCDTWYPNWFEVVPATIGQDTGLVDKNGKKIFEGDIVSTDITRPFLIVEFRDASFMFNCNDGGKDYHDIMLPITGARHTEYGEVIGNVFDNPEFLKGADNE